MNAFEKEHVYDTYTKIALHFNSTRHYVWPNIKEYIDKIPSKSKIADIGCGNGKNMYRNDCTMIGIDFCEEFVSLCQSKGKNVIQGNCLKIPLESNCYDFVLNIAVLHHLSSKERRIEAINELIRITKPNGKLLIQVWGFESKRSDTQDAMIEWNLNKKFNKEKKVVKINRYYYLFKDDELKNLIPLDKVKILNYYNSHNNWVIELEKK